MAIRSGTAHQALELWQLNQPGQKRFADRAPEASLVTGILWTGATPTAASRDFLLMLHQWGAGSRDTNMGLAGFGTT